jgi:hypothetical protein
MRTASAVLAVWTVVACACGGSGSGDGGVTPPPPEGDACLQSGKKVVNGTACGAGLVCQGGACVACVDGDPCVPDTATCHAGQLSCGPKTTCVDTGATADDGTTCAVDHVCSYGACQHCVEGEICQTGGPCYYQSRMSCSQGPYCLNLLGNFPDGSTCVDHGQIGTCESGECMH